MAMLDGTGQREWLQAALLDDPEFLRSIVERTLQAILEDEMSAHLGAERYERSGERRGYRNGTKPRTLTTRVGTLELLVPQDRDGTFSTELFSRYQRTEQALVLSLMEMYVQGVSTRKVAAITEQLCGTRFSKSQVSTLAGRLDTELATWRERRLTAPSYPYVWVDARYEHVRVDGRVVSQGVLLVTGLRGDDGRREILGVAVADTESEATYQDLFRSLKARGLSGVRLVISDDHAGLRQAITRQFQGAGWQRCQVHMTRNLLGQVAKAKRSEVAAGLREVFAAPTRTQALTVARRLATQWRTSQPRVAEMLEEELEDCLACLSFPLEHQARIRTTNGLERLSQELKRRTRVVRIFPNREACLRLVSALAMEQSDEWISGRRYLDVSLLTEQHREPLTTALAAD
ncbi:MAG TPA: IS256 family transposase [Pseudonocardiaceae bacterium]|nr:IS256 family transposase [Pseudonocardiaceae bacterium]